MNFKPGDKIIRIKDSNGSYHKLGCIYTFAMYVDNLSLQTEEFPEVTPLRDRFHLYVASLPFPGDR